MVKISKNHLQNSQSRKAQFTSQQHSQATQLHKRAQIEAQNADKSIQELRMIHNLINENHQQAEKQLQMLVELINIKYI